MKHKKQIKLKVFMLALGMYLKTHFKSFTQNSLYYIYQFNFLIYVFLCVYCVDICELEFNRT